MIWVQAISVAFAVITAAISAPIVTRFERNGATVRQMTLLHRYTALVKIAFGLVVVLQALPDLHRAAFSGVFAFLWVYILFDPLLSRFRRPKRPWHYLGLNDGDGRFWNGTFGRDAGKWKAAILLTLITLTNLYLCLNHPNLVN